MQSLSAWAAAGLLALAGVAHSLSQAFPPCRICSCTPPSLGKVSACEGTPASKTKLYLDDAYGQSSETDVDDTSTAEVIFNNVHARPAFGKTWGDVQSGGCGNVVLEC
ncbi:MAG: hypothetical protein AB1726_07735 [Planctomycetota bacterium]